MESSEVRAAVEAAKSAASSLGLKADDAAVLQHSNRLAALLLPCDVLARIAPPSHRTGAEFELAIARQLASTDAPVGTLEGRVEPRVYDSDGFAVTFWTYYEPLSGRNATPEEYAEALARLHAGMREIDLATPHFTDRVAEARTLVETPANSPDLSSADRAFLRSAIVRVTSAITERGATEQVLHGEPHPGNLLRTSGGLVFIDLETCCLGPVEFDVAHAPEAVSEHYPGIDKGLLDECRALSVALVAAWRWDRRDQFPNGRQMGIELLGEVRELLDRCGLGAGD
jgi:hypothetical protein